MSDTADNATLDSQILANTDTLGNVQGDLTQAQAVRDAAIAKRDTDVAEYNPEGAAGAQPEFKAPTPQDHFEDVMKQAPLLMALGAVGGIFGKQHGITMLASTNAMMKGVVQGNADAYKDARAKYDQQYQEYLDKSKTWLDVYKAYSTAYKGRIDADQRAVQGANAAVGNFEKEARMTKGQIAQMIAIKKGLEVKNAQIQRMSDQEITDMIKAEAAKAQAAASAKRADTGAATAASKTSAAGAAAGDALTTIDELEGLIKNNPGLTGYAGMARRGAEFVTSSLGPGGKPLPATEFQSKMDLLLSKVPEILKQKGGKMGVDQRKKIDEAVSALHGGVSGEQALVKLNALKELLGAPETKTVDGKTYKSLGNGRWSLVQ
jgi:hypothetical protein